MNDLEEALHAQEIAESNPVPQAVEVVAFDTETFRIEPDNIAPKLVCLSLAQRMEKLLHVEKDGSAALTESGIQTALAGNGDEAMLPTLEALFGGDEILVGHNVAYDLAVIAAYAPQLIPAIFRKLDAGQITDTLIREKLLRLSTSGRLTFEVLPDGNTRDVRYSLADLEHRYLGKDRSQDKNLEDSWRLNYYMLDGRKASEYPEGAAKYAMDDADGTLRVYEAQEKLIISRDRPGPGSVETQYFQTAVAFCLQLSTCRGVDLDPVEVERIQKIIEKALCHENLELLVESGILVPATPPRPYKNAKNADGTLKMTKGTKEKIDTKKLQARVAEACKLAGIPIKYTEASQEEGVPEDKKRILTDSDFLEPLREHDSVIDQYMDRQEQSKVVQALERLRGATRCFPNYDVLKETGRTSSYGNRKGRTPLYPSDNIQNQDNRVRGIYVPRPGMLFCSCDWQATELVSLAQKTYSLFGQSKLRELLLAGIDPHAYLGSGLAMRLDQKFFSSLTAEGIQSDRMKVFQAFQKAKDDPELADWWKHWRKFAKPVGLGYPGGLGPKTFVALARKAYDVQTDEQTARLLRDIWMDEFPEMRMYFQWINECCPDPNNADGYAYVTPMGMYRANASYCAAANGAALQSPAAEAMKIACFRLTRAMYDPTQGSCLYGCGMAAEVHDEFLVEIPDDEFAHDRAFTIADIMVESMAEVMPDLAPAIKAEPCLMRKWDKNAKPVFGPDGRLQVWTPKETQK